MPIPVRRSARLRGINYEAFAAAVNLTDCHRCWETARREGQTHRRHAKKNVPIELLRAVTAVVDTGSFTKAADALDLTQSAISAQIAGSANCLAETSLPRAPESADQARPSRPASTPAACWRRRRAPCLHRPGFGATPIGHRVADSVWPAAPCRNFREVLRQSDRRTGKLPLRPLGAADARTASAQPPPTAFLCNMEGAPRGTVAQWSERMVWVKSPKLALSPGAPLPLVGWPGSNADRRALDALQNAGVKFVITFSAPDFSSRFAAVVAGIGVLSVHERQLFVPELEIVSQSSAGRRPA